jgi:acyl carrier protein
MVPAAIVELDALPLTPNGKVDRKALPAPDVTAAPEEIVAPDDKVEQSLAAIVKQVLGLDQISVTSNFFDLGATSLHMIRVHNQLKETFARKVSVTDLFRYATVRSLAHYMSQAEPPPAPARQQGEERGQARRAVRRRRGKRDAR